MSTTLLITVVVALCSAAIFGIEVNLIRRTKGTLKGALRAQTIPQVLIVVGVTAGLALIGYGSFYAYNQWNSAVVCKANLKSIQTAVESYATHEGTYPATDATINATSFEPAGSNLSFLGTVETDPINPKGSYSYTLGNQPSGTQNVAYVIKDPGGHGMFGLLGITGTATNGGIELNQTGAFSGW